MFVTFMAIAQDVCQYMLQTKSLRQDVCHIYVTCKMHAVLQRYFLTYLFFGRCFKFPSLSLCTIVHLLGVNIILIVLVKRKRGGVRRAGARCNIAAIISSGLY